MMITGTMVLEGGATRGVFTSGALDYLMEKDVYLSHVIGVSAGSCNGVDYVSRQPGRTRDCMIQKDKEYNYYFGLKDFIKEKSVLDMDMVFDRYPNEIFPFDFDTYFASEMECEIVITNCVTGRAEYRTEEEDRDMLMRLCRASSSMPLLAPMVNIDGVPYLDGGLADSIPIERALEKENDKIVPDPEPGIPQETHIPGHGQSVPEGLQEISQSGVGDHPAELYLQPADEPG